MTSSTPQEPPDTVDPAGLLRASVSEILDATRPAPLLDVVVPVHDEEEVLEASVRALLRRLEALPHEARVTIADNASRDGTWAVAARLAREVSGVRAVRIDRKGRGHALRVTWEGSDAAVVAYMDVDLSTDLGALERLVAAVDAGDADIAIGSRLAPGAAVRRGPRREVISRGYNLVVGSLTRAGFTDAQCGFKAMRADAARELLPRVGDENWFFDTELLLLAEQEGLRIQEVPVVWSDDPDSRVDVLATALEDLRGLARLTGSLRRRPRSGVEPELRQRVASFVGVGLTSTATHLGGFVLLRRRFGTLRSNAVSLAASTVLNTELNRRFTFGLEGRDRVLRDHAEAGLLYGLGLAVTSLALFASRAAVRRPTTMALLAVITGANGSVTLGRFLLLRAWVFHPARRRSAGDRGQRSQPPPGQSARDRPVMRS